MTTPAEFAPLPMPLPPGVQARLRALLAERERIEAAITLVAETAREAQGVPEGWVLNNVAVGWEQPDKQS